MHGDVVSSVRSRLMGSSGRVEGADVGDPTASIGEEEDARTNGTIAETESRI
jgi:hypothetical protein